MSSYKNNKKYLSDSLVNNTLSSELVFSRVRFEFNREMNFNDIDYNEFKTPFLGFWVHEASDKDFKADLKIDTSGDVGDSIPLKFNMCVDLEELFSGVKLAWPKQEGKWIEIIFFHKGSADIGNVEIDIKGRVSNVTGSKYDLSDFVVEQTSKQIIPVSSSRSRTTIINRSGSDIFLGNSGNEIIPLASGQDFEWTNTNSLFAKVATGTANVIVLSES